MSTIGELARARRNAGISQLEAAVIAGVTPTLVRYYERCGAAAITDERKLARIEAVYREFLEHARKAA